MCSISLLRSYIILDDSVEGETRAPFDTPEEQKQYCTDMRQTCCTDDEFTLIYENVEENVRKIKNLGMMIGEIITNFGEMADEDFEEIFKGVELESFEGKFEVAEVREKAWHIREYWSIHHGYVVNGIRYILRSGAGIACGMCVPANHDSFIGLGSSFARQLIIRKDECTRMLNDPDLETYSNFLNDVFTFYQLSYILNEKFNVNHPFEENVFQLVESLKGG